MADGFKVEQIDHVHVFVRDRKAAAAWYAETLGLTVHYDYPAMGDAGGPLVISSDDGNTSLALFARPELAGTKSTVAFRISGKGFAAFLARLADRALTDEHGRRLTANDVHDHMTCYSVYFCDPDGNPYELTTYDRDYDRTSDRTAVEKHLQSR
jgi:catechol 2,3-dioxygenase-like lactoylglutathione lyase family enzyme